LVGIGIAAGIGALLIATGVLHIGSSSASTAAPTIAVPAGTGADTGSATPSATPSTVGARPVSLPDSLPGFQDQILANQRVLVTATMSEDRKQVIISGQQAQRDNTTSMTVAAYQKANPGASVSYRKYSDPGLAHNVDVIAVGAAYPGLTIGPVADPSYLALAAPMRQVAAFGDVECVIEQSVATPAGSPVPDNAYATMCQRTGPDLTVQVFGGSFQGSADQQTMVALTNDAWTAAGG